MNQTVESEWSARGMFPDAGDIIVVDCNYGPPQPHLKGVPSVVVVLSQTAWTSDKIAVVDIEKGNGEIKYLSRSHLYSGYLPYRFFSGCLNVFTGSEDSGSLIKRDCPIK